MMISGSRLTVGADPHLPGALVVSTHAVDAAGHAFTGPMTATCLDRAQGGDACVRSIASLRLSQVVQYQPTDRYWTFQWLELGLYLGLALTMSGFCF